MTLAQIRARRPIRASTNWLPAPMTLPSSTEVAPRRITLGSSVTSGARSTSQSRYTVDGSRIVTEADRADDPAVVTSQPHELGEVELTGGRRRRDRVDPAAQPGGVKRVQAGVDLIGHQFVGRRVLGLDDRLDRPELASNDPS